jgi:poly(3-hydroxyalkanoate) synthetase
MFEFRDILSEISRHPADLGPMSLYAGFYSDIFTRFCLDSIKFQAQGAVRSNRDPDPFIEQNIWIETSYAGAIKDLCGHCMDGNVFSHEKADQLCLTEEGIEFLKKRMLEFAWLEYRYNSFGLSPLRALRELLESLLVLITRRPFSERPVPFMKPGSDFGKYLEECRTRFENLFREDAFDIVRYCEDVTGGKIGCTPFDFVEGSEMGSVRLRHYYLPDSISPNGKVIYMASPLINRPELFDMAKGKSVVEAMQQKGYDIYLVDPGNPGELHSGLGLDFYGKKVHDAYLDIIMKRHTGQEVLVMGYCMGGTLVLPYLARRAEERLAKGLEMDIKKVALMASPVKFDDNSSGHAPMRESIRKSYSRSVMNGLFDNVNIPPQVIEFGMNEIQPGVRYNVKKGFYERAFYPGAIRDAADFLYWLSHGTRFASKAHSEWIENIFMGNQIYEGKYVLSSDNPALDGKPVNMDILKKAGVVIFDYRGDRDPISPPGSCVASETWGASAGKGSKSTTAVGLNRTIEKNVGHIFVVSRKLLADYIDEVSEFYEKTA